MVDQMLSLSEAQLPQFCIKFYDLPKQQDAESEKLRIIETAANLIMNDIKMMDNSKDIYPSPEDIGSVEKILNLSQSH